MAEFALGLTKTAVEGTLVRVKSAIDEEAAFKKKVRNDLVFITGEFEMLRSFLYAANTAERAKNPVVRTWVRQLRDLAFDVEDCVEFVVHLDTKKSDWWWRVVPSCIAPPLPVDVAVAEIQQLKARVEDVSKRNARYNLLGDDNSMPPNQLIPTAAVESSSPFDVLSQVWQAAGKLRGTGDLKKLITSEGEDRQVISLWQGSCSTGAVAAHHHHLEATYIIKKAYDDPEIYQGFKSRAWIKLMHPFDPDEFLKTLLALFYPPSFSNHQSRGAELRKKMRAAVTEEDDSTKAELMRQVSDDRRYLLVLEGVSTVVDWEAIRMYLPDCNNGSRIVVSTEHLRIALLCTREPYQVSQLTRFSDGQFLCAFSKKGSVRRSDIGEFNWQITRGGVISVVGKCPRFGVISVVPQVYECIRGKRKGFNGVVFEEHSWVDVPRPFDINKFALVLFLNFQSRDFQAKEIEEVGRKGYQGVIERCCKYLHENDCLVVINGLEARKDWDEIKTTFLSKPTKWTRTKSSIIVVTEDETVAKHCAPDQPNRLFDIKALQQDEVLDRLIEKDIGRGVEYSGRAPLFYDRMGEARYWHFSVFDGRRRRELSTFLREQLLKPNPSVISVWGRSRVGKSTLVREIFSYFVRGGEYGYAAYSWVDVPHSFDLSNFSWHLLLDFQSTHEEKVAAAAGLMKGQDPIRACREILHEKKCMVVIDGLQSKQHWDIIRKTFFSELHTQSGSLIIVITNEKSVAKHSVDHKEDQLLKVRRLRDRDSLRLPLIARGSWRGLASKMDRVKLIIAKCGGLPQVISVIAQEISMTYSMYQTEAALATILGDICDNFMGKLETDPRFNELKDLFSWMQSYFDACSDSLKPCIFYLSVFSADKRIRRRRLLRRWIAEGYSRDTSGGGTAEENGKKLFADLVKSSIIQLTQTPGSNDKVDDDVCQVNGFFREYIISRPMEDNLVFALEGCCSINSQRAGQHLTIRNCWDGDEIVFKSIDFTRLRSLTVSGAWRSFFISNDINMELLRVLDLEDTDSGLTDHVLEQIGKQLPRLKFLSVRGCKDITRLPDSLGGLRQLQTLDIRHTKIAILPHSIIKLVKLQYVRAGTTHVTSSEGGNAARPSPDEDDCESTSSEDSLSSEEDGVGTMDSNSLMRTDGEGTIRSQPPPAGDDGMSINYDDTSRRPQAEDDDRASTTGAPCRSKARNAVVSYSCSWWSKKKLCASQQIDVNFGVEAPAAGIGKLTALQTFGVVNVGGARGKSILKELNKLTQLRKLGVCGINRENWQDLCCNILGHGHLKSLSVHLDKDDDGASFFSCTGAMFSSLPKNLKSFKLYDGDGHGNVLVPWVWIKQLTNLRRLTKANLGLAISTQDDIDSFKEFPHQVKFRHVCVKPTQDCELRYYKYRGCQGLGSQVLKIDCGSYKLVIAFVDWIAKDVEVLVVHFSSTESSLKLSGLEWLRSLKEVVLKGSYSEAVKQHLQEQVDGHRRKPVLKLEDGESHQSREPKDPAAPCACCYTCASCCFNGIASTCK
ncbi:uncharacterized protein [Lolium perenne]|uniref:uncharacterized protein isoform X2 n=1 Tax=Lolium perenne TaxID=4522 RepID=UPI003A991AB7